MLNVQKLQYSSTCAACEQGIEGGQGIRLLRTLANGRTGFDFHKDCFRSIVLRVECLDAATMVEVNGVYVIVPPPGSDPEPGFKKVIPKRR